MSGHKKWSEIKHKKDARVEELEQRVEFLERLLRSARVHDPDCDLFKSGCEIQGCLVVHFYPPCNCWLSND